MEITLTFGAWMIPVFITLGSFFWAFFIVKDEGGYLSGITNLFALIPASFLSMLSWMIYAFCK